MEFLIFLDRGANAHLVQGKMAVASRFELISSHPTSLTVVGESGLKAEYGSYRFNLGPGAGGEYHEISCLSMKFVTSKFNEYDLSEICAEFTSLSDPNQSVPPLPKYMGGSEVHLFLGIKNTNLDPVWIKTLPSGVAVYQSVFRDIWGSDIIFAGQHKTFTSVNKTSNTNHSIFGTHSAARKYERGDDLWMDEWEYGMVTDAEVGVLVNPISLKLEQSMRVECVGDIPYYSYRFMGKSQFKFADIDFIPFLDIHEITGNLGSEILTANRIRLGKSNFRSLGGDGIQIDLSSDAVRILEDDRLAYNYWYQLYVYR